MFSKVIDEMLAIKYLIWATIDKSLAEKFSLSTRKTASYNFSILQEINVIIID